MKKNVGNAHLVTLYKKQVKPIWSFKKYNFN